MSEAEEKRKNVITFCHQNIQCLSNKVLVIDENFENNYQCDFLLLTEHWQREEKLNEIQLKNFSLCNSFCRSQLIHGGVAIYKKDNFICNIAKFNVNNFCVEGVMECCCVRLDSHKTVLVVIYRPPAGDFQIFLTLLEGLLTNIYNGKDHLIIGGDFNLDFSVPSVQLTLLIDLLSCFNVNITVKTPTRVTSMSKTCIDNFFVYSNSKYNVEVVNLCISDHFSQFLKLETKITSKQEKNKYIYRRHFSSQNIIRFRNYLKHEDWHDVFAQSCPDIAFDIFARILSYYLEICFPMKRFSANRVKDNFMITPELTALKNNVTLYSTLAEHNVIYTEISKHLNKLYRYKLQLAKREYHDSQIALSDNKSKTMWNIIKNLQKKNQQKSDIVIYEDNVQISEQDTANNFNSHFTSYNESNDHDFDFLQDNVPFFYQTINMSKICEADIMSLVCKLKNSTSCGFDDISNNLLKKCSRELCSPLAYLINLSIEKGIFPSKLKLAAVIPLFKKGDTNDYANYRGISLLSSISKLFELTIKEQLTTFLYQNKILSSSQHGFTQNRSTETALCDFQNVIVNALDNKKQVLGLFIDFSRAFDCVNHDLLLTKLSRYGIRGITLDLLTSYLKGRTQIVKINNITSITCDIKQGVPQGSILGPLLFLVFANDLIHFLNNNFPRIHTICYADDTNILIVEDDLDTLKTIAEDAYQKVIMWSEKNFLQLNKSKTNSILFRMRGQLNEFCLFENNDFQVTSTDSAKMLGIVLDYKLDWFSHLDALCIKLRRSCYALNYMAKHCSSKILLTLYYANFHSHLRYGILNWGTSTQVKRVFIIQKYAIRIIAGLEYRQSCRAAFQNLKILTVVGTYILEVCTYVYKNFTTFSSNQQDHGHYTRSRGLLVPNNFRTTLYQKNFHYMGCKLYNALSSEIKNSSNVYVFKNKLKEFLLQKNCYTLQEFF